MFPLETIFKQDRITHFHRKLANKIVKSELQWHFYFDWFLDTTKYLRGIKDFQKEKRKEKKKKCSKTINALYKLSYSRKTFQDGRNKSIELKLPSSKLYSITCENT